MKIFFLLTALLLGFSTAFSQNFTETDPTTGRRQLTAAGAAHFARLALHCVQTEYPNKTGHVQLSADDETAPQALHPAFYGCFDWHSAVHGHWMLVRLLREFPEFPGRDSVRAALDQNLSRANLLREAAYFYQPGTRSFERMYGWAWLLQLASELHRWDHPDAHRWEKNLEPLVQAIVERYADFLPRQTYPIRVGTHTNTAFGMNFAYDYARATGNDSLRDLLADRARSYFFTDRDCPASWEPSGADFLSPCLEEAALMSRVLSAEAFEAWLDNFLPELDNPNHPLYAPAEVSDRSDPQIVHLDGLNLSRAWEYYQLAQALASRPETQRRLRAAADRHLEATLPHIASGNYEGEHWLASFAVYALSGRK